jgi:hypothetical protein
MNAAHRNQARLQTLVRLLTDLAEAHEELLAAIERKIAALRAADFVAVRKALEEEERHLARIQEREGLRRQLTENIARGYGIGAAAAGRLSARQLAARIGGQVGSALVAAADRLKAVLNRLARRNHVARLITTSVLRHVEQIFAAMTAGPFSQPGYSRGGSACYRPSQNLFDLVG